MEHNKTSINLLNEFISFFRSENALLTWKYTKRSSLIPLFSLSFSKNSNPQVVEQRREHKRFGQGQWVLRTTTLYDSIIAELCALTQA